jgi:hypothetical protein
MPGGGVLTGAAVVGLRLAVALWDPGTVSESVTGLRLGVAAGEREVEWVWVGG